MNLKDFCAGHWEKGYGYKYFVPEHINCKFTWEDEDVTMLLAEASLKLGELNSFSSLVPNVEQFIKMHVTKEAVVSSRIEGTRTNIDEALQDKETLSPETRDDWLEVNNYTRAMRYALDELKTLPLSCRLIRDTHRMLLSSGRGKEKMPGEFRTSQNWLGGATITDALFVPPSHVLLPDLMGDLEKFLNNDDIKVPPLVRIAIAHYQFETIHPFLDGNGRTGRLLIPLFLIAKGLLKSPTLYLSEFFERNRQLYYDNLMRVHEKNDITQWIKFFLIGIKETSKKGSETLSKVISLKSETERIVLSWGARSRSAYTLLQTLFDSPYVTIQKVMDILDVTARSAAALVNAFVESHILQETTGRKRDRRFAFREYIDLFA